jgi:O-antigen ligase
MRTGSSGAPSPSLSGRGRAAVGAACLLAIALGAGIPAYVGLAGGGAVAVVALPVALFLGALFLFQGRYLFLIIMASRSACDVVFESARAAMGGAGPGLGGLVNAAVIGLALLVATRADLRRRKPLLLAWAWFFCSAGYGLLLSPDKAESARLILSWLSNFAVFYFAATFVTSIADFKRLLWVIVASSVVPVGAALSQVAAAGLGALATNRVQGTFTHPNILAFYLAFVISVAFYQLKSPLFKDGAWRKALLALWMGALIAMLLCTQTRSAWLACILMFVLFGVFFERRYLLYLLAICCLALLVEPIRDRIIDMSAPAVETSQTKLDSFRWRVELWQAGLGWMEFKHYFLGYGIGAFSANAPLFFDHGDGFHWDAHNVYVQWFFDVGLVGLACYVWIHGRILYLLRPLAQVDRMLSFIIAITVISYLTVSFSDNMMFYLAFNWYYWLFLGAASALLPAGRTGADPAAPRPAVVVCR